MRVFCSAFADWTRALQKHKQAQRRTTLALTSTQVTRGRDAEHLLTRERLLHTYSTCLSTEARAYSSERYTLLQSARRKQLISGSNFFCLTRPPPSPSASPAPRRGSESELSFTANPKINEAAQPRHDQRNGHLRPVEAVECARYFSANQKSTFLKGGLIVSQLGKNDEVLAVLQGPWKASDGGGLALGLKHEAAR